MYMTERDLMYKTNMLVTGLNKNYIKWLSCVTDNSEYSKESDKFNHGLVFLMVQNIIELKHLQKLDVLKL